MRGTMIAIACLLLGGCSAQYWTSEGKSAKRFYSDYGECRRSAYVSPSGEDEGKAGSTTFSRQLLEACLQERGWYIAERQFTSPVHARPETSPVWCSDRFGPRCFIEGAGR